MIWRAPHFRWESHWLILPHDGSTGGPRFSTWKCNPREATKLSLKKLDEWFEKTSGGLLKDQVEYVIYMGIRAKWIENLDEIQIIDWIVASHYQG
jgi:hypothetical protein